MRVYVVMARRLLSEEKYIVGVFGLEEDAESQKGRFLRIHKGCWCEVQKFSVV